MARYTGPVCRQCRAAGQKLFLKGDRCNTAKCAVSRRSYRAGQHGQSRQKVSEYGLRLHEKQKLRRTYGMLEKQFHSYFEKAAHSKGVTGEELLKLLERRLDNVVYRMGFAASRPQARQFVCHGHIQVDGKRVDIPSYLVKPGQMVKIAERSAEFVKNHVLNSQRANAPEWLSADAANLGGQVLSLPHRGQIDAAVREALVVEYYSR